MLLRGDDEARTILRQQAQRAQVSSREMTGVGFFTRFTVVAGAPRVMDNLTFKLGNVEGTARNVKHGLGFLLYVENGVLSMLEGYTYDEPWPEEIHELALRYSTKHVG